MAHPGVLLISVFLPLFGDRNEASDLDFAGFVVLLEEVLSLEPTDVLESGDGQRVHSIKFLECQLELKILELGLFLPNINDHTLRR